MVPVSRLYNRIVFDELEKRGVTLPFDWRDELDVTWVCHPNWYWIWSKDSLPRIHHPYAPRTWYLSEVDPIPTDCSDYILKPLFSFAGTGGNPGVGPVPAYPYGYTRPAPQVEEAPPEPPPVPAANQPPVKLEPEVVNEANYPAGVVQALAARHTKNMEKSEAARVELDPKKTYKFTLEGQVPFGADSFNSGPRPGMSPARGRAGPGGVVGSTPQATGASTSRQPGSMAKCFIPSGWSRRDIWLDTYTDSCDVARPLTCLQD